MRRGSLSRTRRNEPSTPDRRRKIAGAKVLSSRIGLFGDIKVNAETRFSWDEADRQSTLNEHGVDLLEAALIFERPEDILIADSLSEETRDIQYHAIGRSGDAAYYVVLDFDSDRIRLLSAARLDERSEKKYEERLAKRASRPKKPR